MGRTHGLGSGDGDPQGFCEEGVGETLSSVPTVKSKQGGLDQQLSSGRVTSVNDERRMV